jgi:hypothetical protein
VELLCSGGTGLVGFFLLLLAVHLFRGVSGVLREGNGSENDTKADNQCENLFHVHDLRSDLVKKTSKQIHRPKTISCWR